MEIIDFHTHPFIDDNTNICSHRSCLKMTYLESMEYLKGLGVTRICGSVLSANPNRENIFESIKKENEAMLELKKLYGDFYIPGFHVHPGYLRESLEEIERMHKMGINLIGELVPYRDGWDDFSCKEFSEILDLAEYYNMVVSFHSMNDDAMDKMVKQHKNVVFVAAHPGDYREYCRHLERMKMSENYYLDLSGAGFIHGVLRRGIQEQGVERFIFGSDYPCCNPAMYIGGVLLDTLLSDYEKECIFAKNIKRLLKID